MRRRARVQDVLPGAGASGVGARPGTAPAAQAEEVAAAPRRRRRERAARFGVMGVGLASLVVGSVYVGESVLDTIGPRDVTHVSLPFDGRVHYLTVWIPLDLQASVEHVEQPGEPRVEVTSACAQGTSVFLDSSGPEGGTADDPYSQVVTVGSLPDSSTAPLLGTCDLRVRVVAGLTQTVRIQTPGHEPLDYRGPNG